MLIPKKTKYRYNHYPKYEGQAKGNREVSYGDFGLRAYGGGGYVSNKTIEAVRMGSGKGSIES
ncbi:hypothetical protein C1645_834082 [Glomus cerebriforme]|uniref:Uncharacterized protein n=1 Tax=Glomus cerebriforme TaxID=658196 RepID=A0A397SBA4_9GLOM|nr:hypothetical protein C1645_834082 [Glomus cerebriforme]